MSQSGAKLTGADAAREAIRKRQQASGSKSPAAGKTGGDIRFYTDETPGLRVTPKTVLITSLVYLGIVVVLHLFGKLRSEPQAPAS